MTTFTVVHVHVLRCQRDISELTRVVVTSALCSCSIALTVSHLHAVLNAVRRANTNAKMVCRALHHPLVTAGDLEWAGTVQCAKNRQMTSARSATCGMLSDKES